MIKCEHITNCIDCGKEVCSYCVEDCSGCQEERCKKCYKLHQVTCSECLNQLCPDEVEQAILIDGESIPVCPICNMQNVDSNKD